MKTERLFYDSAYTTEFEAVIEEIQSGDTGLWLRLNRTAFYPEGGGQPCDIGTLAWKEDFFGCCESVEHRIRVVDVQERDEAIWHRMEADGESMISRSGEDVNVSEGRNDKVTVEEWLNVQGLSAGTVVSGQINWERRLDLMQQHSGEHIVSGLIHARHGYDNVGFHLSMDTMTIDLSGELSWEELMEIEAAANRLIRKNVPVEILYPSAEELALIPYRSKKKLTGEVRIVQVPGGDICACCGTHVSRTGEIGMVKMISMQKWKSGVRVWLCCGERAEEYCRMLQRQNRQISVLLSAKPEETALSVERVAGELSQVKYALTAWKYRLFDAIAAVNAGKEKVILFEDDLSMEDLRHLADRMMKAGTVECMVFSGKDGEGYCYVVGSRDGDVRSFVKELNGALDGRGGGMPQMAQGTVRADRSEVEKFLREKELLAE